MTVIYFRGDIHLEPNQPHIQCLTGTQHLMISCLPGSTFPTCLRSTFLDLGDYEIQQSVGIHGQDNERKFEMLHRLHSCHYKFYSDDQS